MRVLIALGGNAMTGDGGSATQQAQERALDAAMEPVADLIAAGVDVVITHGNGPQVGNLLVKNELARDVVPPVGLDWCVAQTQATIGFMIANSLERSLADRGIRRPVTAVVSRTRVDPDDPAFTRPTKPVGRYVSREEAERLSDRGHVFSDRGERGWRRVVASPEPLETLDASSVEALTSAGHVVVASGGGGIPVTQEPRQARTRYGGNGTAVPPAGSDEVKGVEAVIDKDLAAALLARTVRADTLVIATDVEAAALDYGAAAERPLGAVGVAKLREYAREGAFGGGSMGPKVEAALRFVENGGERAVIASLARIAEAARGAAGTVVTAEPVEQVANQ